LEEIMEDAGGLTPRPRERIISTARDLFRKHGIRGIGVDAIAEAANTNKMTLYRHFRSKDDLIVACLRDVASEVDAIWNSFEQDYPGDPLAQLNAWVRVGAECAVGDGRGCDLANVAVELAESDHPARHVIEEFKKEQRDRLAKLCHKAGIAQPELLADTLSLLLEGARVSRQSAGLKGPSARYVAIGDAVIAAFAGERQSRKRSQAPRPGDGVALVSPPNRAASIAMKRAR
jgi:AcrR family transcriptional regulator